MDGRLSFGQLVSTFGSRSNVTTLIRRWTTITVAAMILVLGALGVLVGTNPAEGIRDIVRGVIGGTAGYDSPPPTKKELGQSGWTLIHMVASNFDAFGEGQRNSAAEFFKALGNLYPCEECAAHFRAFMKENPPDLETRESLLIWTCKAHNEVNRRNQKPEFLCTIPELEKRWGSCGCT
mmetsp:Transcript_18409/g.38532  ORF Transcript_18409/g.38532 Transcript_18409/m.38532 type:complete len:179 (-) Transcript_18409:942-1478(-)